MNVAKTNDSLDYPPNVPMMTGPTHTRPHTESFSDALSSAATAFAKALSPPPTTSSTPPASLCSPSKMVDVRMRNLEEVVALKQLFEDGVITEKEFLAEKQSLTKLV
jgi:hypothetical protein